MKFREFTKSDWYAFAGAERFPDGSEPLISVIASADEKISVTFIIALCGVEVLKQTGDETENWFLSTSLFATQKEALGWAEAVDWSPEAFLPRCESY